LRQFRFFRPFLFRPPCQQFGLHVALWLSLICSVLPSKVAADHGELHTISPFNYPLYQNCWIGYRQTPYEDPASPIFPSASAALEAVVQNHAQENLGKVCLGQTYNDRTIDYFLLNPPIPGSPNGGPIAFDEYTVRPGWFDLTDKLPIVVEYKLRIQFFTNFYLPFPYHELYYHRCFGGMNQELYATMAYWRKECGQNLHVKLSPLNGLPESSTTLNSIEPGKDTSLVAQVYDQNNQLVPNVGVQIEADVVMKSGGHEHHDSQRPKGKLNGQDPPIITGNTGASGFSFTFNAPAPAGDHTLTATCTGGKNCTQQGPDRVWVGVKDLVPLYGATLYALVGSDAYHPDNHYLTSSAQSQVMWLVQLYRQRYPNDPVLHLNDASLERGGLFDIQYPGRGTTWWTPPHKTHRFGVEIDIRANSLSGAIPATNFKVFEGFVKRVGASTCPSAGPGYINTSNQHYHVCLMGGNCCQGGNR